MYRVMLGKISAISDDALPALLLCLAPDGGRRAPWIAGRALLMQALALPILPEIVYGENGKPAFGDDIRLWFNISHSGDDIAVLVSDTGEVGCDLEVIRPRRNWPRIAQAMFSSAEQAELMSATEANRLTVFWRIWTQKEARLKYAGQPVWAMATQDSHAASPPFCCQHQPDDRLMLALCTSTPYRFAAHDLTFYPAEIAVNETPK